MKFCISPADIKKFGTSNSAIGAGKTAAAALGTMVRGRFSNQSVPSVVLLLPIPPPFLFVQLAFLVVDSSSNCSSAIDCVGWRLFGVKSIHHRLILLFECLCCYSRHASGDFREG